MSRATSSRSTGNTSTSRTTRQTASSRLRVPSEEDDDFEQSDRIEIVIAIFQPAEGRFYHWAIGAREPNGSWTQYEANQHRAGSPYSVSVRHTDPRNSSRCVIPMVRLASIRPSESAQFHRACERVRLPRRAERNFNCQTYVDRVMEALENERLISSTQIRRAQETLEEFRGATAEDLAGRAVPGRTPPPVRRPGVMLSEEFVYDSDSA